MFLLVNVFVVLAPIPPILLKEVEALAMFDRLALRIAAPRGRDVGGVSNICSSFNTI